MGIADQRDDLPCAVAAGARLAPRTPTELTRTVHRGAAAAPLEVPLPLSGACATPAAADVNRAGRSTPQANADSVRHMLEAENMVQ
jgi:hypothetical protein